MCMNSNLFISIFIFIFILHALIHLLGFVKAFEIADVTQLSQPVTKANGLLWLTVTIVLLASAIMLWTGKGLWWAPALIGAFLSQYLIITSWQDAKFGTIANVIILSAAIIGYGSWHFHRQYLRDVEQSMTQSRQDSSDILTEAGIAHLPHTVQKYLHWHGAVGKPVVRTFKVDFSGCIRSDAESAWMPFTSEQYNFIDAGTRLFFMKAKMKGLPVAGYHRFADGKATMDIRLFSLFKVQYQSGPEMDRSETVTFFNDMCCMAPATLIDERITWHELDSQTVDATFTQDGMTISARLFFDTTGRLIHFVSPDRYALNKDGTMQQLPWSTPLRDPQEFHGYQLSTYADAVYAYPEGDLVYGEFRVEDVWYGVRK